MKINEIKEGVLVLYRSCGFDYVGEIVETNKQGFKIKWIETRNKEHVQILNYDYAHISRLIKISKNKETIELLYL